MTFSLRRRLARRARRLLPTCIGLALLALVLSSEGIAQVARSYFLIDSSGNALASATTTPGGSDRALVVREAGTPTFTVGTFPDNEPFNLAQVSGTALSTSQGIAGTGTPRVTTAIDSDVCNPRDVSQVAVAVSAVANTQLVALTAAQTIYVCDVTIVASGTVAVQLIYGTGTACATGETDMSGPMDFIAQTGWTHAYEGRLKTAEANALCIELSAAVAVNGVVTYRKVATF